MWGPAIIRHVVVKVDGQPVVNWIEALRRLVGPGEPRYSESDMSGRVLAAGESLTIFTPHGPENNPILYDRSNPLFVQTNKDRERIEVEICYCSTLGDCWTLRAGGMTPGTTTETRRCATPSDITFQQ